MSGQLAMAGRTYKVCKEHLPGLSSARAKVERWLVRSPSGCQLLSARSVQAPSKSQHNDAVRYSSLNELADAAQLASKCSDRRIISAGDG
jgi:hypothetical protein